MLYRHRRIEVAKSDQTRLDLFQQFLSGTHVNAAATFKIQLRHHAVFNQSRITLRTHTEAASSQIKFETELLGVFTRTISQQTYLAACTLIA